MLRVGIILGGVWLCVQLSVCTTSRKLWIRSWSNLVVSRPMVNARSDLLLVTCDFDFWFRELFLCLFLNLGYTSRMALPSSFIFNVEIHLRLSWLWFSFKVMGLMSRSQQCKRSSMQFKNYWPEIAGDINIYSEFIDILTLTFYLETYFSFFSIQAPSFECLELSALFSVWEYIFRISRSPLSFMCINFVSHNRADALL